MFYNSEILYKARKIVRVNENGLGEYVRLLVNNDTIPRILFSDMKKNLDMSKITNRFEHKVFAKIPGILIQLSEIEYRLSKMVL